MTPIPSISIVTPSFNQGTFLAEALLSVREQRYDVLEHLVIDGGSDDDTIKILCRYSGEACWKHLHWISEPDHGQSHALNKGFAKARGDIIGWLNSDDRYRHGCLNYVSRIFQERPDIDVVYGDYTWIDENGRTFQLRREIEFSYFILLYHRVLYIPTTATFFRRRVIDEGNWLDESLCYAMDFEFFVRLASRGYRFLHVRRTLGDFRFQRASKTCRSPHKQLDEVEQLINRNSPVLRRLESPAVRVAMLSILRSCAAAMRYSEKLIRGYYFDRFRAHDY
ncbi:MAG: glycosyltransferase [Chloroflexi bacterium]|nr:MAG: glycosyltransferase [Chloroflexota bacterium]